MIQQYGDWYTGHEKFVGLGDVQNVRLQHQHRPTVDNATDQWRHSQTRILSSFVANLVRKCLQ